MGLTVYITVMMEDRGFVLIVAVLQVSLLPCSGHGVFLLL